jgi:hypothetical protein
MAGVSAVNRLSSLQRFTDGDVAIRLRVSHLVESVDFEPDDLPPAATLIVRRFVDPMPRGLRSHASALVPSPSWESAARSGLADLARGAARPARDAIPSNAKAVLFADQAELLACFSHDLLRGEASSLWWWRVLLRTLSSSTQQGLVELWRREARYVPAALAHLAARRQAEWVLNTFSSAQAWTILEDVTRAFEIGSLCTISRQPFRSSSSDIPAPRSAWPANVEDALETTASMDMPPWHDVLAEDLVPARLEHERMALLGVCLMLGHSPAIARSRRFAAAFSHWYRSAKAEAGRQVETKHWIESEVKAAPSHSSATWLTERPPVSAIDLLRGLHQCAEDSSAETRASENEPKEHFISTERNSEALLTGATSASGALNYHGEDAAVEERTSEKAPDKNDSQRRLNPAIEAIARSDQALRDALAEETVESPDSKLELFEAIQPISQTLRQMNAGDGVVTELGGILFLVNVLKALRLPGSLEQACDCELGLGSWEMIELIARCMIGPGYDPLSSDPIWIALASLDGRSPQQKAGIHFASPNCYRIPGEWISALRPSHLPGDLAIRLRGRQLEVWHRIGFPCMIRQFEHPPSRSQIERAMEESFGPAVGPFLRRYPRSWAIGRLLDFTPERSLRSFLSFLLPFIGWRLAAAISPQRTQKPVHAEDILLRTGKIWVTSSHVDLVMDLRQATGPVRLAGLDADPGWVPELGRVIKFHFQ